MTDQVLSRGQLFQGTTEEGHKVVGVCLRSNADARLKRQRIYRISAFYVPDYQKLSLSQILNDHQRVKPMMIAIHGILGFEHDAWKILPEVATENVIHEYFSCAQNSPLEVQDDLWYSMLDTERHLPANAITEREALRYPLITTLAANYGYIHGRLEVLIENNLMSDVEFEKLLMRKGPQFFLKKS
jgi:hypothetical protein